MAMPNRMQIRPVPQPVREDRLMGLHEVATRLGISYPQVKRLVGDGRLPSVRLGDRRLVRESDLSAFIAALPN